MATNRLARQILLLKFGHLYKREKVAYPTLCYYCGDPASDDDHCPNLEFVAARGSDALANAGVKFLLLPACAECNRTILNKTALCAPIERYQYVQKVLRKRYAMVLELPEWEKCDIKALGPNLRKYIKAGEDIRRWVHRRSEWFPLVEGMY